MSALLACFAVFGAPLLHASENPLLAPDAARPQAQLIWLKTGNYTALEEYYARQQRDYEAGRLSDQSLYDAFRRLYEDSVDNEGSFDRWADAFPSSYAAILSRGAYLYRMAWSARGDRYISQTRASQIDAMNNWLGRAQHDLTASLTMTSKPYLSALYLLNVAGLVGTAAERRHWYEMGIKLDPAASMIRYRYMSTLRPRWGGSYGEMEAFLRQCEEQHLQPALLARLSMLIHADRAEDAMRVSDEGRSFDEWREVIRLARLAGEQPSTEALIGFTRAAQDLNRSAAAASGIALLADRKPDDTDSWSLAQLGWVYARAHQDVRAWPLLTRAAELNDPWAQWIVGNETYHGEPTLHMTPDREVGLVWIRRAAVQCYPEAVRFLATRGLSGPEACPRFAADAGGAADWWAARRIWLGSALLAGLLISWVAARRKRPPRRVPDPLEPR